GAAGGAEAEVQAQHALGGVAVAGRHLARQPLAAGQDGDAGAHGVAVRLGAGELDLEPGAPPPHLVAQQGVAVRRSGDGEVDDAAVPEVGGGDAAAVEQQIGARRAADLLEGAVAAVEQMTVALPAVPGASPEVLRVEEAAGLVLRLLAHDVVQEVELDLGSPLVVDPAVGAVEVLPAVVVEIGEDRAPEPAQGVGPGLPGDVLESAVAAVAQQVVAGSHLLEDLDEAGARLAE